MKAPQVPRSVWFSLAVLLTLLSVPSTRWIVRGQVRAAVLAGSSISLHRTTGTDVRNLAERNPADFALQLVAALDSMPKTGSDMHGRPNHSTNDYVAILPTLQKLAENFPSKPVAAATYLRYACGIPISQPHEPFKDEFGNQRPVEPKPEPYPKLLAEILRMADAGTKLDPDNALFPIYKARVYFHRGEIGLGLAAVVEAGNRSRFEDYATSEIEARWAVARNDCGEIGALRSMALSTTNLSHLPAIRSTALSVFYQCWLAEREGRQKEAMLWRESLMRFGGLMRSDSRHREGSHTGSYATAIGGSRMEGREPRDPKTNDSLDRDVRTPKQQDESVISAAIVGGTEHGNWFSKEYQAVNASKDCQQAYFSLDENDELKGMYRLFSLQIAGTVVCVNVIGLLCLAGVALLCRRIKRTGTSKAALVSMLVLSSALAWLCCHRLAIDLASTYAVLFTNDSDIHEPLEFWHTMTFLMKCTAVPLLITLFAAIAGKFCKVPVSTAVGRAFRGLWAPSWCVMMVIYAGLVSGTAMLNSNEMAKLTERTRHEGKWYAKQIGREWPGKPAPIPPMPEEKP